MGVRLAGWDSCGIWYHVLGVARGIVSLLLGIVLVSPGDRFIRLVQI